MSVRDLYWFSTLWFSRIKLIFIVKFNLDFPKRCTLIQVSSSSLFLCLPFGYVSSTIQRYFTGTSSSQCVHQICSCIYSFGNFFCYLLMHVCIFIAIRPVMRTPSCTHWRTHWLSNCNSQAKCIHAWADNIRIWEEEVPVWVYAFWVCKPVNSKRNLNSVLSIYCSISIRNYFVQKFGPDCIYYSSCTW